MHDDKLNPLRIALVYAVVGASWVVLTDWLAGGRGVFHFMHPDVQTIKGLVYVAATAIMVYLLILVTGRRTARERAWYRELFEANPQPMWVYDLETLRFLEVNAATVRHYGYSREEFLAMTLIDIRPSGEISRLRERVRRVAVEPGSVGFWLHRRKDGSIIRVETFSHTLSFKGRRAAMTLAQDITARLEAEERVRRSEERLRAIVEHEPEAIMVISVNGRVQEVNPAGLELLQASSDDDVTGHLAESFVHPEDLEAYLEQRRRVVSGGVPVRFKFRLIGSRGRMRWVEESMAPLLRPDGSTALLLCVSRDITEAQQAQEALRASEARFREMAENVQDIYYNYDPGAGRMLYVSPSFERIWGRPLTELYARPLSYVEGVHPKDRAKVLKAARRLQTGRPTAGEFRVVRPDGSVIWVQDRSISVAGPDGKVVRIVGTMRDVTAQKSIELALHRSEERFRLVTRATNDLIWDVDAVKNTIWWGEGFERLFGCPLPEGSVSTVGFWEERVHPEDRQGVFSKVDKALERGGETWSDEYRLRREDGSYVHVLDRGFVLRDEDGKAFRMIGSMTDLTERKIAEDALRRLAQQLEKDRLRLVAAQAVAKVGSWETDLKTLVVTWSEETFRIFETDPRTFAPTHAGFLERVHPEDRETVEAAFKRSFESTEPQSVVHRLLLPGGRIKHVEENWRILRDPDGVPVRALGTCQDITTRVALESQYLQSQKLEAVGRLAGGVAHDFNNMLTVILVRAEQALRKLDPGDPARAAFQDIHDAATRSAELTRQLLTYARRQTATPRVINLNDTVTATRKLLQRLIGEDVKLDWVPGSDLWSVRIDPGQVDQILANLCVNARDAIRDTGHVVVETHNVSLDAEYCRVHQDYKPGDYVMLVVTDNGSGMDAETRAHVFEPFFTTKEVGKGTGLGLPTVYGIVQQNGGFINVYSEPGNGTSFRIYLPRHGGGVVAVEPAGARREVPASSSGETILVVEDEGMILGVAMEILGGLGYKVLGAVAPDAAIELVRTHPGDIHLLLTDVVMPGMNGRELAERIRSRRAGIRVLFMSGYTANVMATRGLFEVRETSFVQKPFSTEELAARVRAALDAPAS